MAATTYIPVYRDSARYAREHGEIETFIASQQETEACVAAVEAEIAKAFDGMRLSTKFIPELVARFGVERMTVLLAHEVREREWDGRIQKDVKIWANKPYIDHDFARRLPRISTHSAIFDGFVRHFIKLTESEKVV